MTEIPQKHVFFKYNPYLKYKIKMTHYVPSDYEKIGLTAQISKKRFTSISPKSEAATRGALWKKVFLKCSQNSQENTCARVSFLIKLQAPGLQLY